MKPEVKLGGIRTRLGHEDNTAVKAIPYCSAIRLVPYSTAAMESQWGVGRRRFCIEYGAIVYLRILVVWLS